MLVWKAGLSGSVELRLYRVDRLEPIPLRDTWWSERNIARRPAVERLRFPRLPAGVHEDFTLRTAVAIDELLLLAARSPSSDDDPALAIYVWEPGNGTVTVLPQGWFTRAAHDLGYEWVTQIARDPKSGRIFGTGIRVGSFELEDDGMTIRRWFTGAWGERLTNGR
jgi:hypothetical protein